MPSLTNTIEIDAQPDAVWGVLGDLEAVTEWIPGIASARVEGSARYCVAADGSEIREEISDYSAERRSYGYAHLTQPVPIANSRGSLRVEPNGGGSRVVWEAEFDVLDPGSEEAVTAMLDGAYKQTLSSLRRRIEGGAA
jgi:carbon monoxide dehydrogenase subunit G